MASPSDGGRARLARQSMVLTCPNRRSSRYRPPGTARPRCGAGIATEIPAAADAPTLDALLERIAAMALDLLPDNHPEIDPGSLSLQITALREADPVAA